MRAKLWTWRAGMAMVRSTTRTSRFVVLLALTLHGVGPAVPVRVLGQDSLLSRLAGSWVFDSGVLGPGFIGSTFPGESTPPTLVNRQGETLTFNVRLQVDQDRYGTPITDDFIFTLAHAGPAYRLSAQSKSWLQLTDLPLKAQGDSELAGSGVVTVEGKSVPLTVAIQLNQLSGHSWQLTATGADGRPVRRIRMGFRAPTTPAGGANPSSINGHVTGVNGEAMAAAEVKLSRLKGEDTDPAFKDLVATTDAAGAFAFEALEAGSYMLTVSAVFPDEASVPCRPTGLLARNRNKWLVAVGRTKDGKVVEIVTSDPLAIDPGQARTEVVDFRCREAQ